MATEQTVVMSAEQLSNFPPPKPGLQCNDSRGANKYGNATDKIYNTSIQIHVEFVKLLVNSVFVFRQIVYLYLRYTSLLLLASILWFQKSAVIYYIILQKFLKP